MTALRMIELAAAVAILVVGVGLYRRPKAAADKADGYGSQGAVILFVVAGIMAIHALGWFEYHPSKGELEALKDQAR